ncbi:hypothetical protein PG987_007789 [Apiospora arundinis]
MSILPEWLPQISDGPAQKSPDGIYQFDNPPNNDACGLAAASITFLGAFISVVLLSQSPGLWVHLWNIRVRDLESFIKKQLVFDTCYSLTMIFVKAAVLVEWARMFVPAGRDLFFWTCYTTLSTNGLLYVAAIIAGWLTCTPPTQNLAPLGGWSLY